MVLYLIIALVVATRFLPHPANFVPITAVAIFAAVYLPKKQAVAIPLLARFVSDLFLGFASWPLMVAIYASHLVGVLFGLWVKGGLTSTTPPRQGRGSPPILGGEWAQSSPSIGEVPRAAAEGGRGTYWIKIILSSLGASVVFFLVTNFALLYSEYPHTLAGIWQAYVNGLPFFRGTLLGDLAYTAALFGGYQLAVYAINRRKFASSAA